LRSGGLESCWFRNGPRRAWQHVRPLATRRQAAYPPHERRPRIKRRAFKEHITAARFFPIVLATLVGLALSVPPARADIYTWTDANGRVNISNLAPPDGVKVTSIVRETPQPLVPMPLAVGSAPQPDLQALNDRLRQLELEVELAKRQTPPTIVYASATAQPPVQYAYPPDGAPAPDYGYGNAYGYGCDPSWFGCGLGYGYAPFWYLPSIVVVRTSGFHQRDFGRGRYPIANPLPGHGPGAGRPPPGTGSRPPGGPMSASFARR